MVCYFGSKIQASPITSQKTERVLWSKNWRREKERQGVLSTKCITIKSSLSFKPLKSEWVCVTCVCVWERERFGDGRKRENVCVCVCRGEAYKTHCSFQTGSYLSVCLFFCCHCFVCVCVFLEMSWKDYQFFVPLLSLSEGFPLRWPLWRQKNILK